MARPSLLLLGSTVLSLACAVRAQLCPLTGMPPLDTYTGWYRCPDVKAAGKTCCQECTDLGIGLSLVSSNASTFLNAISPVLVPALQQTDINFCTMVYPSASCQDNLEQLACAMQCNPDSWKYINVSYTGRTFSICKNFADALLGSCQYAQIRGSSPTSNQTFLGETINPKYFLQALANAVTSLVGLQNFQMVVAENTTMCYAGPVVAPKQHVCCDTLGVATTCPPSAVDFKNKPWMGAFSGNTSSNPVYPDTCRAAPSFPLAPVTPLSPPPPNPPGPFFNQPPPLSFNNSNTTQATGTGGNYPPPPKKGAKTVSGGMHFLALSTALIAGLILLLA